MFRWNFFFLHSLLMFAGASSPRRKSVSVEWIDSEWYEKLMNQESRSYYDKPLTLNDFHIAEFIIQNLPCKSFIQKYQP